jgi:hypothetical protein
MTFSSKHPAALAAYRRCGMEPQWRLLYLKGPATGGKGHPVGPWRHDRLRLVEQMARQGAHVSPDVVWMPDATGVWLARLQSDLPIDVLSVALAGLPRNTAVSMCVPDYSPVATWSQKNGFVITDYDTFCATPHVQLPPDLHCLNPGLA